MITLRIEKRNAAFQVLEALKRSREKRAKAALCFCEGVHPLECALKHGWTFEAVATGRGRLSGWAGDMIGKAGPATHYLLSDELMAELSEREDPCELIALLRAPRRAPTDLPAVPGGLYVLLDRPQSPGNLGSAIRTMDSLGVSGLLIAGHAADPMDPQCIRASIGTVFALPHAQLPSHQALQGFLAHMESRGAALACVGTSARASALLPQVDFTGGTLVMFGNETLGLSDQLKSACGLLAGIPLRGSASSLNLACAASIVLYEAARQRGFR